MNKIFLAGLIIILIGMAGFAEGENIINNESDKSSGEQISADIRDQLNDINKKLGNINNAIIELNKKYDELESEIREIGDNQERLTSDQQAMKAARNKDSDNMIKYDNKLKDQSNRIDELSQELRVIKNSFSSLAERQSLGENKIKENYSQEVEKTTKTSKLINIIAISLALVAVTIAL